MSKKQVEQLMERKKPVRGFYTLEFDEIIGTHLLHLTKQVQSPEGWKMENSTPAHGTLEDITSYLESL